MFNLLIILVILAILTGCVFGKIHSDEKSSSFFVTSIGKDYSKGKYTSKCIPDSIDELRCDIEFTLGKSESQVLEISKDSIELRKPEELSNGQK